MCLNPLHISTLHTRYYNLVRPFTCSADVPCGHCLQCKMTNRNDLFLRTKAEYTDCVSSGGSAIFLTFTYDEFNVPYSQFWIDDDGILRLSPVPRSYESHQDVIMHFRKSDMQNYLKSLRKYVKDTYGLDGCIRYICVPEYGTDLRYTCRPHYHCIFFLSLELVTSVCGYPTSDSYDFNAVNAILSLFCKFWRFGNVTSSKLPRGLFISSESCCSYVTKYVSKNLDLLSLPRFQDLLNKLTYAFNKGYLLQPFGHHFSSPLSFFLYYARFYEYGLFVVKSIGYGLSMLNDLDTSDPLSLVDTLDRGIPHYSIKYGRTDYLRYPRYIVRKLFYNHRKDGTYYYNDLGLRTLDSLHIKSIENSVDAVRKMNWSMISQIPFEEFCKYRLDYNSSNFNLYVDALLKDPYRFFVYCLFMRYRVFTLPAFNTADHFLDSLRYNRWSLSLVVHRFNILCVDHYVIPYSLPSSSPTLGDNFGDSFFESLDSSIYRCPSNPRDPRYIITFQFYEEVLRFWTCVSNYFRGTLLKKYDDLAREAKRLSDIINYKSYSNSYCYGFSQVC